MGFHIKPQLYSNVCLRHPSQCLKITCAVMTAGLPGHFLIIVKAGTEGQG